MSDNQLYLIFNVTDGIYASPDEFTSTAADTFITDFPKRFAAQGYYLTGNRERIAPELVELEKVPYTPDDEDEDNADEFYF